MSDQSTTAGPSAVDWSLIIRAVLVFAVVGCVISVIVQFIALVAEVRRLSASRRHTAGV